jgi:hypothetical protein
VRAASEGLKSAISTAKAADNERLFGELFQNLAFTKALSDQSGRDTNALALFQSLRRPGLSANPVPATKSGRVYRD